MANKQEALQAVTNEGSLNRAGRSPAWDKAFEAYNQAHNEKLNARCGSCFRKVKKWLES